MKKAKILLATAAVATAITCAFGVAACNNGGSESSGGNGGNNDSQITAIYELYSANAQANGETVLTYEQWLQSIKGETGATGATGATGKSAYDIAVENGFEGTVTEWLESLKGEKGDKGEDGAKGDKGDKGEDGQSGSNGADGVGIEGIYETSEGTMVKFTDGTVKPLNNDLEYGKVEYPLLQVGDNDIELSDSTFVGYNFLVLTEGKYELRVDAKLMITYSTFYYNEDANGGKGGIDEKKGGYLKGGTGAASGQWEDNTDYWAKQIDVMAGCVHTFKLKNTNLDNGTSCRFSIVKVEDAE